MRIGVCADMTLLLFLEYLGYSKKYAGLLDIAELIVYCRAEHAHRGRQSHVGIDKRRDIVPMIAYGLVEYLVIFLERIPAKQSLHGLTIHICLQRTYGGNKPIMIGEILFKKIQDHVTATGIVARIHRDLAEQLFYLWINHSKSA